MKFKPATESEAILLGALLLDSELFSSINDILTFADFHYEIHKDIFYCMKTLNQSYGAFDIAMIIDSMEINPQYLYELENNCPSTRNIKAHASIIREKSVQKKLIQAAECFNDKECLHDYEVKYKCYKCGKMKDMNTNLATLHDKE